MKNLTLILMLVCGQLLAAEVKVRVVDETGAPVSGAETKIIFVDYRSKSAVYVGNSDRNGRFDAHGHGTHSVMIKVAKTGHYFDSLVRYQKNLPGVPGPEPVGRVRLRGGGLGGAAREGQDRRPIVPFQE